jgi:hypothetical protein
MFTRSHLPSVDRWRMNVYFMSVYTLDVYRGHPSMTSSVLATSAAPYKDELLLRDPFDNYSVPCSHRYTLLHSTDYFSDAMFSIVKITTEAQYRFDIKSGNFDSSNPLLLMRWRALQCKGLPQ